MIAGRFHRESSSIDQRGGDSALQRVIVDRFHREYLECTWRLICVSVMLAALVLACGGDSSADLGGREITVAVENSYLPFSYVDAATGEARGWDYDMLAELCERLDCEPVFVPMPWEPTLAAVGSGDIDMAASGIVINAERDRIVDFSDSYASAYQYLFARTGEDRFDSVDELVVGDYMIAAQVNTVNSEKAVELVGAERVVTFTHLGEAVTAVAEGEADAFIHLLKDGQQLMGAHADEVGIVGDPLAQLDYGFIFSEGSDLVTPFNEALAAVEDDGILAEMNDRYFGPSFSVTPEDIAPPVYDSPPVGE